jgi:hypothetical protein
MSGETRSPKPGVSVTRGRSSTLELVDIPPRWLPLNTDALAALGARSMPASARLIGQLVWDWSHLNTRMTAYHLSMDRAHRHWLLWASSYDTNWDRWQEPVLKTASMRGALQPNVAARWLLMTAWSEEALRFNTDRFTSVAETGLLQAEDLEQVADVAWGVWAANGR